MTALGERPDHDVLRSALGAYALGQLDDDLRSRVDSHLTTCDACGAELAEIAPLAEALRAVDPWAVGVVGATGVVAPPGLDERISQALPPRPSRTRPLRRWVPAAVAAMAAAAAAAIVITSVVGDSESSPAVIAVPRVESADGVTASAGLVDHTWGLEIKLEASGLAAGEQFSMWVVGQDGQLHEAGQFVGVADTRIVCDMSSSVLLDDAASFRVVDASGDEVISADIPS